jgi:hypothetical protein
MGHRSGEERRLASFADAARRRTVSSKRQGKMVLYSLTPPGKKLVKAVLAGVPAPQGAKV